MKLYGSVILAALLAASCNQKSDKDLLSPPSAPVPAAQTNMQSAAPVSATAPAPSIKDLPAGDYKLDPVHSTFFASISHLGFSNFTMWFDDFGADLALDPAHPGAAKLTATVNPASLTFHAPPKGFEDDIRGEKVLDAKQFPTITFKSNFVTMKGPNTADVTGDLTMHGLTKPVTLNVTFNGGYEGHMYEPRARIGFSAKGVLKRTDFGMDYGVPKEGSNMGTSDDIHITIEAEFLGPPMKNPPAPPAAPPT